VGADVYDTEVVGGRHRQAFGWANGGAQSAKAALAHVDIEGRGVDAFGRAIGSLAELLGGTDGFDGDAVDRTDLGALVTYDTVVNFIVKFVAPRLRDGQHLMRVLYGGDAMLSLEVVGLADISLFGASALLQDMRARKPEAS
jgi:hypothetical protein